MNKPAERPQNDGTALRMRSELKDLLNLSPGAREVLPHLAGLDRALKTQGLAAFDALPARILKRASAQLQSVYPAKPGAGIVELRSRLAQVLDGQDQTSVRRGHAAQPSSFLTEDKLQVSEASESDFMRAVEAQRK